jgi:predicted DNA-binding protein YlxM (UPF0122 family)
MVLDMVRSRSKRLTMREVAKRHNVSATAVHAALKRFLPVLQLIEGDGRALSVTEYESRDRVSRGVRVIRTSTC